MGPHPLLPPAALRGRIVCFWFGGGIRCSAMPAPGRRPRGALLAPPRAEQASPGL